MAILKKLNLSPDEESTKYDKMKNFCVHLEKRSAEQASCMLLAEQ